MIAMLRLRAAVQFFCLIVCCLPMYAAPQSKSQACDSSHNGELDFWIGDWDVFDAGSENKVAAVRVEKILGSCVLHEKYEDPQGLQGESFSVYDAGRKAWFQTWVTNRGQVVSIQGRFQGSFLEMSGTFSSESTSAMVRATWKPTSRGVRETAERSFDDGKSWQPWFNLDFRPRVIGAASAHQDARIISSLDKQYQAAVKANDASTMDRILADDFLLVEGSGRTLTKKDLLAEARSKETSYEQQDELEQAVRVWNDTAVVTAKLWEKGTRNGKPFDYKLWFSDVYVRTPNGWRYVLGQASRPLDPERKREPVPADQSR